MNKELKSYELQRYLDCLDFEPPRNPYDKQKRDKIRDEIRKQIEQLKWKEIDKIEGRF
jgi:hypothetical protein